MKEETAPYLLTQVHGAQLGRLHFGVHHHVEHGADGLRHAEVRGPTAPLKLGLERRPGPSEKHTQPSGGRRPPPEGPRPHPATTATLPFDAGLDHVAGHQLQPGLQVFTELLLGPVQIPDEGLQSIQLPEEVLRGAGAVTAELKTGMG